MSLINFLNETARILEAFEISSELDSSLEGLDSMAITEICVVAEEELGKEVSFDQMKGFRTYGDLLRFLEVK